MVLITLSLFGFTTPTYIEFNVDGINHYHVYAIGNCIYVEFVSHGLTLTSKLNCKIFNKPIVLKKWNHVEIKEFCKFIVKSIDNINNTNTQISNN